VAPAGVTEATPDVEIAPEASTDTSAETLSLPSAPALRPPTSAAAGGEYGGAAGTTAGAGTDYGGGTGGGAGGRYGSGGAISTGAGTDDNGGDGGGGGGVGGCEVGGGDPAGMPCVYESGGAAHVNELISQ